MPGKKNKKNFLTQKRARGPEGMQRPMVRKPAAVLLQSSFPFDGSLKLHLQNFHCANNFCIFGFLEISVCETTALIDGGSATSA